MTNKSKILKIQLTTAILTLLVLFVSGFFIFGPDLVKVAKALTGDYGATKTGVQAIDWQRLDDDFLARNGGNSMGVDLDMANHRITNLSAPTANNDAVTMGAMQSSIATATSSLAVIKNISGTKLRMICGETPDPTPWVDWGTNNVAVNVDTTSGGFSSTPFYFTSLKGTGYHLETTGGSSVYTPTATGFKAEVHYIGSMTMNATVVKTATWNWRIQWCAIGE